MILRRSWHSPPPQTRLGSNGDNEQFRSLTQFNLPRDGLFPESVQAIHLLSARGPILRFENVPACPHPCCQQIPAASKKYRGIHENRERDKNQASMDAFCPILLSHTQSG